jgi:hypothetical protein
MSIVLTLNYKLPPSKYDPWKVIQWFQRFFHSSQQYQKSFSVSVCSSSVTTFVRFPSSRNNDPSTSISTYGRGRNRTLLNLGCMEDVEVQECSSSPEILKSEAQCEQARYRVQHPIVCTVPLDSLGPFSKSFQDIFVEGMINCLSWRYKFFVHNATAVEKNNKRCFHPESAHVCFLQTRKSFVCHSALCSSVSGQQSNTHDLSRVITLSKKFGSISSLPSKS